MNSDRAALVEAARIAIARGSKSFSAASRLFDRTTRERAWLLYAWCRRTDDLIDGQDHGHGLTAIDDAPARLALIRDLTARALAGERTGDPAFDALGVVAAECAIPHALPFDVIEGFALDAAGFCPRSEDDLLRYCYHVAGAVGVMMAIVMGVPADDDATLDRACDLGLAFQLANIARDLSEDDAVGRCYVPMDWLSDYDIPPGELMRPIYRKRAGLVGCRLATLAAGYEESARAGTPALPFRSAWAVLAAAGIYGDIAREVIRRRDHSWDRRIVTTKADKLGWIAKAGGQALRRQRFAGKPRDGLWTRPRTARQSEDCADHHSA
ncbi:phytoene/squalene synthase family protein [Sphingomonas sp. 1P06PA]|uniref:phytoene/squalene synthase family protein n=1 Tax=Sphingomonas sp. 1P06PA TaxID=554121 RepID=UPI0039A466F5